MTSKNGSLLRKFVLISIPFLIVWILLFFNIRVFQRKNYSKNTIFENELSAKNSSFLISDIIGKVRENSSILAQATAVNYLRDNSSEKGENDVLELFEKYIISKRNYKRIRFYNYENEKLLSVELNFDNEVIKKSEVIDIGSVSGVSNLDLFTKNSNAPLSRLFFVPFHDESNGINSLFLKVYTPIYFNNILSAMIEIDYDASLLMEELKKSNDGSDSQRLNILIYNSEDLSLIHNYQINSAPKVALDYNDLEDLLLPLNDDINYGYVENDDYLLTYFDLLSNSNSQNIDSGEKWLVVKSYNMDEKFPIIPKTLKSFIFSHEGVSFLFILALAFITSLILDCIKSKNNEIKISSAIAKTTNDAVIMYNNESGLIYLNDSFNKITGYNFLEVKDKPNDFLLSRVNDPDCQANITKDLDEKGFWKGIVWSEMKNGLIYPAKFNIFKTFDKLYSNHHVVGIFADLTNSQFDKENPENSLNYIKNLRNDVIVKMISSCTQQGFDQFLILYITIENYNYLMDLFNIHDIDLLETFVSLIRYQINKDDIIAKIGKNQICVIIDSKDIKEDISVYMQRFSSEISKIICINSKEIFYKTKIGVSRYPEDTSEVSILFNNTLIAHEWANMNNDVGFSLFNREIRDKLYYEKKIFRNLKKAVDCDELFIVYQPQMDILTNKIVGMEALLRWNSTELGFISPSTFIPIAENNHMMINLGKWIIERVCSDLSYILSQINSPQKFRCAINISTMQLEDSLFLDHFFQTIEKNDLNYNNIEIEITENIFISKINRINSIFQGLREKGISIAIDDFGTGYSSFLYLKQIPIDKIKIDRAFIKDYPSNDNGDLAKILIKVSKSLKKSVLVEGAETEEQISFLKNMGCELIQGFYHSRPLVIEDFIKFVNENQNN